MSTRELAERLITRIAEKLNEMKYSGMDYNTALVTIKNDLMSTFEMDEKVAGAFRDLGLELYSTKYKNQRVFNDAELQKMLDIIMPPQAQERPPQQQTNNTGW
jgi:hypothetical protein